MHQIGSMILILSPLTTKMTHCHRQFTSPPSTSYVRSSPLWHSNKCARLGNDQHPTTFSVHYNGHNCPHANNKFASRIQPSDVLIMNQPRHYHLTTLSWLRNGSKTAFMLDASFWMHASCMQFSTRDHFKSKCSPAYSQTTARNISNMSSVILLLLENKTVIFESLLMW